MFEDGLTSFRRSQKKVIAEAREESRRMGVPNVSEIDGRVYYELPNGELSLEDPYVDPEGSTE